jgi:hypothetical protein
VINFSRLARQALVILPVAAAAGALLAAPAHAHRPFDMTDADVLSPGRLQVKPGVVNISANETQAIRMAPGLSFSYGLAPGWEITAGGKAAFTPATGQAAAGLGDLELAAKTMWREGSLQGKDGPSLATEVAALLPGIAGADPGLGAAVLGVASWRFGAGLAHLGALAELGRDGQIGGKTSLILEGPEDWTVRPVAEGGLQAGLGAWSGSALSLPADPAPAAFGLVGGVLRVSGDLGIDLGVRLAASATSRTATIRSGLSYKLP